MKSLKIENAKLHVIFWSVYIIYEMVVIYSLFGQLSSFGDYFGHYVLNIGLFYFNAHIVLPNTAGRNKKSYLLIPVALLAEVVVYIIAKFLIHDLYDYLHISIFPPFTTNKDYAITSLFRCIDFLVLSTGYWFALSTIQNRKRIADLETIQLKNELDNQVLEKALLTTENAYLKSQINPHFLLNTLNFLYNSVSKFSEKIADSVMTLSEIMSYALTNADEDGKVWLESEVGHISNFIKLNQARFSERLQIELNIDGDMEGLRIIPLVLITLAENVFKYGDLQNAGHPAKISVGIAGSTLTFITENLKKKHVMERSYGIGIKNVKNRLAMYHKYELNVEEDERFYRSVLKIEL